MQVIILAGGKGTRLKPYTVTIPKPLVPVGEMPILEIILRQLNRDGFNNITMAVNHHARLIKSFFGDGSDWDLSIDYSIEDKPLGTAGPIRLVENLDDHFLVMNGDILTTLNYQALKKFHIEEDNAITISTFRKCVNIDSGVLEIENGILKNYLEKPQYNFMVSMGIYCLRKDVVDLIPKNSYFDLPQLVLKAKKKGLAIGCYHDQYEWLDIGRVEDYEKAIEAFDSDREKYLKSLKTK